MGYEEGGNAILSIRDLHVRYDLPTSVVTALDGIDLDVRRNEIVGLIGESGSGKTTLGRTVVKLLPSYAKIVSGSILFEDQDLVKKDEREMRKIRGGKISVIFQNPTTSLNPSLKIGDQIAEVIGLHQNVRGRSDIRDRTVEILERVGIRDAEERLSSYPYEFSVGMRQRVMIAMALSASPKLVVADEPTSALDVSIQSQILELMRQLEKELQFSMIFITHHLGVAVEMCDRIAIMYAAKVMEYADKVTIFTKPKHPYTFALMKSMPFLHKDLDKLWIIKGDPPDLTGSMNGCRFHPRCFSATEVCKNEAPPLVEHEPNHFFACFHPVA